MDTKAADLAETDKDKEAILLEMMRRAEGAPEPGTLKTGDAIDSDTPIVGSVQHVSSAGYVTLYNTRTGVPSPFNRNMLPDALRKRHNDPDYPEWLGKPAYEVRQTVQPFKGDCLCLLHKDHAERTTFTAMGLGGLPVCRAAHLASPYEVEQHMKKKHRREWDAIQNMRAKLEKEEDKARQNRLVDAMISTTRGKK